MSIELPEQGLIFWPVGTGDSTTIRINETVYMQVDLHHMEKSESDADTAWPIVDALIALLPRSNGKPYLSTFALTHPDKDHCQGFAELSKKVTISEIWLSPRVFREFQEKEALCPDAEAFENDAIRRVKATIAAGGDPGPGDRVRIIGYDDLLAEDRFKGFPKEFLTIPGQTVTVVDGENQADVFKAFVHAPFKEDSFGDRNNCSIALQVTLINGAGVGQALLMGDLKYPTIRNIFDRSEQYTVNWNVLLAPHHCSKSVMYWKSENEEDETLKEDIVRDLGNAASDPGYVVASSTPVPASNDLGDNPPHALAKVQYERIVPNEFLCTHEHKDIRNPQPIVFGVTEAGLIYVGEEVSLEPIENALKAAGAGGAAATSAKGFGVASN